MIQSPLGVGGTNEALSFCAASAVDTKRRAWCAATKRGGGTSYTYSTLDAAAPKEGCVMVALVFFTCCFLSLTDAVQ